MTVLETQRELPRPWASQCAPGAQQRLKADLKQRCDGCDRISSSSRRGMSATASRLGAITASGSSDPRFRESSRVPSGERASPACHGLTPPPPRAPRTQRGWLRPWALGGPLRFVHQWTRPCLPMQTSSPPLFFSQVCPPPPPTSARTGEPPPPHCSVQYSCWAKSCR